MRVHDFEPGIAASGLFWTAPVSQHVGVMRLGAGRAAMRAINLPVSDYHDFFNSIGVTDPLIPAQPATVSFDVQWRSDGPLTPLRDATNGFTGQFMDCRATIA